MTMNSSQDNESSARSPFSGVITTSIWGNKNGRAIFECPITGAVFFDRAQIEGVSYQDYYWYLSF